MKLSDFAPHLLNELSPATLASYKKKAGAAATAADAAGDVKTGNKRFSGIVKATKKQFDQDAKGVAEAQLDEKCWDGYQQQGMKNKGGRQVPNCVPNESLNEFAPGGGNDDDSEDPYKYPKPEQYRRSADYFGQFEAGHFDREDFDDATGVFKGYWGDKQIAYFKFDNPARTGSDDPGMGWYYEPESSASNDTTSAETAAFDNSEQRKQQELGMINAFLKSGQTPKPGSQIDSMMKRYDMTEDALAGMKRLAGIAPVRTPATPGQRQYRHMPTAAQPR